MEKALEKIVEAKENMNIGYIEWANDCIDEAIAELEEAMKPKTCEQCENHHKDRTIFYNGKKALMCTFCKYGAVSYFKPKDNE